MILIYFKFLICKLFGSKFYLSQILSLFSFIDSNFNISNLSCCSWGSFLLLRIIKLHWTWSISYTLNVWNWSISDVCCSSIAIASVHVWLHEIFLSINVVRGQSWFHLPINILNIWSNLLMWESFTIHTHFFMEHRIDINLFWFWSHSKLTALSSTREEVLLRLCSSITHV